MADADLNAAAGSNDEASPEARAGELLAQLNDLLDAFPEDDANNGSTATTALKELSEIVVTHLIEYESMEPDPYDTRHIERVMPDCVLANVIKKIENDPELLEKVFEHAMMGGSDEESLAGAHYLALTIPLVDMEAMDIHLNELVGLDDFLFVKVKQLSRQNREMPLYCLSILSQLLESKQQALSYREQIRELVSPLMKRCYELNHGLMRRLRKHAHPIEMMADSPMVKRSRTTAGQSTPSSSVPPMPPSTPTTGLRAAATATSAHPSDANFPSTPTLIPIRIRTTGDALTATTPGNADRTGAVPQGADNASGDARGSGAEPLLRGVPPPLAEGLVSPQVTAAELSAEERPPHDCALYPMTDAVEMRIIAVALASVGYLAEIQGIFLPYALKTQMVGCLINLSALYAQKRRWLLVVDVLKLVSRLVAHKKFALELVANGGVGVRLLLTIPPSSPASTAVMNVFCSLAENNRDTMERIYLILQSKSNMLLEKLVGYSVDVLECGHNSARSSSGLFLCHSFILPPVKDCFEKRDGLRKLLNQVMTLTMMAEHQEEVADEELELLERQRVRDTFATLQTYFLTNFNVVAKSVVAIICSRLPDSSVGTDVLRKQLIEYADKLRGAVYNSKLTLDNMSTLILYWPGLTKWPFVNSFMDLGGVQLLLRLIVMASKWKNSPTRVDILLNAVECLAVLSLLQSDVRLALCETFQMPDGETIPAMSTLLEAAEGTLIDDISVQSLACQIICCCVCPDQAADQLLLVSGHDHTIHCGENYTKMLPRAWTCVRNHQGIRVLVQLIQKRTKELGADGLRTLACMALSGLSRCAEVKQILSKLPLFNSGQMLALMAEPLVHDRAVDHRVFCHFAQILINNVTGKSTADSGDTTLAAVQQAYVVGQTKITYPREELLQVIHRHLIDQGLPTAAMALQIEAKLPSPTPTSSASSSSSSSSMPSTPKAIAAKPPPLLPLSVIKAVPTSASKAAPPSVSKKLPVTKAEPKMALDVIVTHFLRDQHSKCAYPMAACPPFSLSHGHRCPVPQYRRHAPSSPAMRFLHKQVMGSRTGFNCGAYDRQLIYSRYRPSLTFEHPLDSFYSAVSFMPDDRHVIMGCQSGEITMATLSNDRSVSQIVPDFECNLHSSRITSLVPSKSGRLVLSSAVNTSTEQTILWSVNNDNHHLTSRHAVGSALSAEFANLSEDRFITSYADGARIFDTATTAVINELLESSDSRHSGFHYASFHPRDDLVLSNGVLWDTRQPTCKVIRQFDSLNSTGTGMFHPKSGIEVIINTGVWDLRTFNLLTTCPQLDNCRLRFNHAGNVLFGVHQMNELEEVNEQSPDSALQVVDADKYTAIATVPMKKQLFDFNISSDDSCVAVVENYSDRDWITSGSDCRLYLVGQQRHWLNDAENENEGDDSNSEEDSETDDSDGDSDEYMLDTDDDEDDLGDLVDSSDGSYGSDDHGDGDSEDGPNDGEDDGGDEDEDGGDDVSDEYYEDEDRALMDAIDAIEHIDDPVMMRLLIRNGNLAALGNAGRGAGNGGAGAGNGGARGRVARPRRRRG